MGRYRLTNSCLAKQVADWVLAAAGTPQLSRIYTVMTHARPAALPAVHVTYRRSCLTHIDVHEIGGKRSAKSGRASWTRRRLRSQLTNRL